MWWWATTPTWSRRSNKLNGIDVFYGLGNFVFDQTWDLAHQQGVMLLLHFSGIDYTGL